MTGKKLSAGTAVTVITPPLKVGSLVSSVKGLFAPFRSVRLPLKARVLAIRSGEELVVLVSLDVLALNDTSTGGWEAFKQSLSDIIPPERIIITCTHTHNAPESVALTGLYRTGPFKDWLCKVRLAIREAIVRAVAAMEECRLSLGSSILENYSLRRRVATADGIVMSDSLQPVAPELLEREPVDRRVHSIRFYDTAGNVIATIVHAVCHPVHEMCLPHISPDFPGELCLALESFGSNGMPLFLNGAAGNINPPTVSLGPDHAKRHGLALAEAVNNTLPEPIDPGHFTFAHRKFQLPIREDAGVTNPEDAVACLNMIRIGSLAIVFLPGEPFVETALEIEYHSPFKHTLVAAFSENTIGYIPTAAALREGGYEAGPGKWSFLKPGAEEMLKRETLKMLESLQKTS